MLRVLKREPENPPLFFAFPDGVYDYVCAECNALCCRGHGFGGSLRREMGTLLTLYPRLGVTAASRHGDVLDFHSPAAGCVFLDRDNLCGIEKRHGRALKPGVCSLFPFNSFTRIGRVIAVSPHFLCPLRLHVPARPGDVTGTHARLAGAVQDSGLLEAANLDFRAPAVIPARQARTTLKRETAFRDLCARSLGRRRFADTLRDASEDARALTTFRARVASLTLLEAEKPEPDRLDDVLLALASPLRLGLLSLPKEAVLRVLALGEGAARSALSLSAEQPTVQTAHKLIIAVMPALKLLARDDAPFTLPPDAKVPAMGAEVTLAAFIAQRAGSQGTLDALEQAIEPSMSTADRWLLLDYLGQRALAAPTVTT
jgi:hypothetical protein